MNEQRIALRQRRDLGEIIQAALHLYQHNFAALFVIAAVVVPLGIASATLAPDPVGFGETYEVDGELLAFLGIVLLGALVTVLASAAIIAALAQIDQGGLPEFSSAFDAAFERVWTLLGAALRAIAIVVLLSITVIGIPWAIQRAVRWLFVPQAVMLDNTTAREALAKSASAVEGRWWRTLAVALVILVIVRVPGFIIAGVLIRAPALLSGTVNSLMNALLLPLAVIAITLLYFDLQVRKEPDERIASDPTP